MKENQRVKLTKMILKDSLTNLLQVKHIHSVSVRELCDAAQINRSTFYKYYGNPYDLFMDIQTDFLRHIDESLDKNDYPDDQQRILNAVQYAHDNAEICKLLINNSMDKSFPEQLFDLPTIRAQLDQDFSISEPHHKNEIEYAYQFIINGGYSLLKSWIMKDNRESPAEIAQILFDLVIKVMD